jgi:hypothetical protein
MFPSLSPCRRAIDVVTKSVRLRRTRQENIDTSTNLYLAKSPKNPLGIALLGARLKFEIRAYLALPARLFVELKHENDLNKAAVRLKPVMI